MKSKKSILLTVIFLSSSGLLLAIQHASAEKVSSTQGIISMNQIEKPFMTELNYQNIQSDIDQGYLIGTVTAFDGRDGETTYFAGHNPGIMKDFATNMHVGNIVTVLDSNGESYSYKIVDVVETDMSETRGHAVIAHAGVDLDTLYKEGSHEESIVIQYCETVGDYSTGKMLAWYGIQV